GATGLTIAYDGLPAGASVDPGTGAVTWRPALDQVGEFLVFARVSDGQLNAKTPFLLRASVADVAPDVLIVATPDFPVRPGQSVSLTVRASSFLPIETLALTVDGVDVALDGDGRATVIAGDPGRITVEARAVDSRGVSGVASATIKVRDPDDRVAPQVVLAPLGVIGPMDTPLGLAGTVDDTNLDIWRLTLTHQASGTTRVLAEGVATVSGVLHTLDPADLPNGFYDLTLFAQDVTGRTSATSQSLEILSTGKASTVRTETDAVLTVAGNVLALTRQHDSLSAGIGGDFGNGWRAPAQRFSIAVDKGSTGFDETGLAKGLNLDSRLQIALPDGSTAGFSVTASMTSVGGGRVAVPALVPDSENGWMLETLAPPLILSGGRFYDLETGRPHDPASALSVAFRLTAPDGTAHHLAGDGSVVETVFADGTRVWFGDTGISSADGMLASYTRDVAGRIEDLRLSDGARTRFAYDTSGQLVTVRALGENTAAYVYDADGTLSAATGSAPWWRANDGTVRALGSLAQRLADGAIPQAFVLDDNGVGAHAVMVRGSEIESKGAPIILVLRVVGATAPVAATAVSGLAVLGQTVTEGVTTILLQVNTPGLHAVRLDGAADDTLSIRTLVAGDLNADGRVDGNDSAIMDGVLGPVAGASSTAARADITGDGLVDRVDQGLLSGMLGFAVNEAPVLNDAAFATYVDLETEILLPPLAQDPEDDPVSFRLVGVAGGTAVLSPGGQTVRFTPEAGFAGEAEITLIADDGFGASGPRTYGIAVKDIALLDIDIVTRTTTLDIGGVTALSFIGDFVDQEDVPLPASYLDLSLSNTDAARLTGRGLLIGEATGFGTLIASRGDAQAVSTYIVGNLDLDTLGLSAFGFDVYPDTVTLEVGTGTRDLLLFDVAEDPIAIDPAQIAFYSSNSAVAAVGDDGVVRAGALGDAVVTVIYQASEVLVPVKVLAPQTGVVSVGRDGGVVENAEGYQVAIPPDSLSRPVDVEIRTRSEADLPIPGLPSDYGWTFGAAFELDMDNVAMGVPMQLAIPTGLAPGSSVLFYRYSDLPTADGWQKGWQQVESGIVDENGFARTKSPPDLGALADGFFAVYDAAEDAIERTSNVVTAKLPLNQASSSVTTSIGGVLVGAFSAGPLVSINVPIGAAFNAFLSVINADDAFEGVTRTFDLSKGGSTRTAIYNTLDSIDQQLARSPQIDRIELAVQPGQPKEIVITGERFGAGSLEEGTTIQFVAFGNGDLSKLEEKLESLERKAVDDGDIPFVEAGGFKAYRVFPTGEQPGKQEIRFEVPAGIKLAEDAVRVVRFDPANKLLEEGQVPPIGAKGTKVGEGYVGLKYYSSGFFNLDNNNDITVAVVAAGQPGSDGTDASDVIVDKIVVMKPVIGTAGELPQITESIFIGHLYGETNPAVKDGDKRAGEPIVEMGTAMPREVVTLDKGGRAYVTLERAGAIAVVDLVNGEQVDVPGGDGTTIGLLQLKNLAANGTGRSSAAAAPFDIILTRDNRHALVSDRKSPTIYVIDVDKTSSTFNQHVHTFHLDVGATAGALLGLRHIALTPDGSELVVTAASNIFANAGVGAVYFFSMPDITQALARMRAGDATAGVLTQAKFEGSNFSVEGGTLLRQPYGVTTRTGADGKTYAFVTDKSSDANGVLVFRRDNNGWVEHSQTPFGFVDGRRDYSFEPNDASQIVITPDLRYAFVMAQNRFVEGDVTRDPNYLQTGAAARGSFNPVYPAGSMVTILADPFGEEPQILGALRPISESWGTELTLSGDNRYLYASGGAKGAIFAYDVEKILEALEGIEGEQIGAFPASFIAAINDYAPGANDESDFLVFATRGATYSFSHRLGIRDDIDVRADLAVYPLRSGVGAVIGTEERSSVPDSPRAPLGTGPLSLPTGLSSQTPFVELQTPVIAANGQVTLPWSLSGRDLKPTIYISVLGPGEGLFPSDTPQGALDYLFFDDAGLKLPFDEKNTASERLLLADANRNRIFAKQFDRAGENGKFNFLLPDTIKLTRGQTYWWGIEVIDEAGRLVTRSGSFKVPVPEVSGSFSGVTIVTHGFEPVSFTGASERPTFEIATDIAENTNGTVALYDPDTGLWRSVTPGRPTIDSNKTGQLVLVVDWIRDSAINDSGFSEAAADAIYASLVNLAKGSSGFSFDLPLHFIGHGRGAVVNSEIAERVLAFQGKAVKDVHFTTIDPHDSAVEGLNLPWTSFAGMVSALATAASLPAALVAPPVAKGLQNLAKGIDFVRIVADVAGFGTLDWTNFQDPKVTYWSGIDFFDNYYQDASRSGSSFTVNGRSIPEANINRYLGTLPGLREDDEFPGLRFRVPLVGGDFLTGWGTTHNRAAAYYAGTADLNRRTFAAPGAEEDAIWRSFIDLYNLKDDAFEDGDAASGDLVSNYISRFYPPLPDGGQINLASWYRGFQEQGARTLFPSVGGKPIAGTLPAANDSYPFEGVGEGWFYSAAGGGTSKRPATIASTPTPGTDPNTVRPTGERPISDVFNGDFDASFRPVYGRTIWLGDEGHGYEVPGWSLHGGSGGLGQGFSGIDASVSFERVFAALEPLGLASGTFSAFPSIAADMILNVAQAYSGKGVGGVNSITGNFLQFSKTVSEFAIDLTKTFNASQLESMRQILVKLGTNYEKAFTPDEKLIADKDFSKKLGKDVIKGVATEVARVLVPMFVQWLQSDVFDYGFKLSADFGDDATVLTHNRMVIPDDLKTLGFDVSGGVTARLGTLTVYFDEFGGGRTQLKTLDGVSDLTFGNGLSVSTRVLLDTAPIKGKVGTLSFAWKYTFEPDITDETFIKFSSIVIDNINRNGALRITESSQKKTDGIIFFKDDLRSNGASTVGDDLNAIARPEFDVFGKTYLEGENEHTITIINEAGDTRSIVLRGDGTSFARFEVVAEDGTAT
ncbi:MAG: Ig-like domain-containing protein, partial [Pseudomonadota bacterium]